MFNVPYLFYDIENPKGIIINGENIVDRNDTLHQHSE
jgi:hypothetical protein